MLMFQKMNLNAQKGDKDIGAYYSSHTQRIVSMVKNTHGGNKHKQFARKHATEMAASASSSHTRVSTDPNEVYAVVIRMLGNGMFHCYCMDRATRLGHMRGKFSGRGKRDNMVKVGTWVLIGLREWEQSGATGATGAGKSHKMQHCDLLNVYSDTDKVRLRGTVRANWSSFDSYCDTLSGHAEKLNDDHLRFADVDDDEMEQARLPPPQRIPETKKAVAVAATTSEEEEEEMSAGMGMSMEYTLDDI